MSNNNIPIPPAGNDIPYIQPDNQQAPVDSSSIPYPQQQNDQNNNQQAYMKPNQDAPQTNISGNIQNNSNLQQFAQNAPSIPNKKLEQEDKKTCSDKCEWFYNYFCCWHPKCDADLIGCTICLCLVGCLSESSTAKLAIFVICMLCPPIGIFFFVLVYLASWPQFRCLGAYGFIFGVIIWILLVISMFSDDF